MSAAGLWAAWGAGLLALLIRRPVTLTAIRILVPCGVVLAVLCLLTAGHGAASPPPPSWWPPR